GLVRGAPGALGVEGDDRVDGRVDPFDPVEVVFEQLTRRELAPAQPHDQRARGTEMQLRHASAFCRKAAASCHGFSAAKGAGRTIARAAYTLDIRGTERSIRPERAVGQAWRRALRPAGQTREPAADADAAHHRVRQDLYAGAGPVPVRRR